MRAYSFLLVLVASLAVVGCGAGKSGDPKDRKATAKQPASADTRKAGNPDPEKPAKPAGAGAHRKLLTDLLNEKIPPSPSRKDGKDGLEAVQGWKVAAWEDPAHYKRFREKKTGLVMMYLGTKGGSKGKSAAIYTKDLCLAPKGALKATVYNYGEKKVGLAIAFWFSNGWVYYESKQREIHPHTWTRVSFDLAAADYKTASSKWQHKASLWKREDTKQVAMLLYHKSGEAQLLIDGLTVDQAPRPKPKPKPKPKPAPKKTEKAPAKEETGKKKTD